MGKMRQEIEKGVFCQIEKEFLLSTRSSCAEDYCHVKASLLLVLVAFILHLLN